mmetsp:Transcript_64224/g.150797  ORF Transcript_64224/g.150797 Transcript_64224/m.150797 type:complete len:221 (-) Transcript_64224:338-1000(-)
MSCLLSCASRSWVSRPWRQAKFDAWRSFISPTFRISSERARLNQRCSRSKDIERRRCSTSLLSQLAADRADRLSLLRVLGLFGDLRLRMLRLMFRPKESPSCEDSDKALGLTLRWLRQLVLAVELRRSRVVASVFGLGFDSLGLPFSSGFGASALRAGGVAGAFRAARSDCAERLVIASKGALAIGGLSGLTSRALPGSSWRMQSFGDGGCISCSGVIAP